MAARKGALRSFKGNKFYYLIDEDTNTYEVYAVQFENDYQNTQGSLIYKEKLDTLSKGSSDGVFDTNQDLIRRYGNLPFLDKVRQDVAVVVKSGQTGISEELIGRWPGAIWRSVGQVGQDLAAAAQEAAAAAAQAAQDTAGAVQRALDINFENLQENLNNLDVQTTALPNVSGGTTLRYPLDLDTAVQDHLQISIYKYVPAKGLPSISGAPGGQGRYSRVTGRNQKFLQSIVLPVPNAIRDSNAVDWGAGKFSGAVGTVAQGIAGGAFASGGEGEDIASLAENILQRTAGTVGGTIGGMAELASSGYIRRSATLRAIGQAAGKLGVNVDTTQIITRLGGVVENPNLELLFSGPSLRTFELQVRLTPRSAFESARIRRIIRAFKQHSAVKRGATLAGIDDPSKVGNLLLGTPDVFILKYLRPGGKEEIKGVTKTKTCALTNVQVDYTGESGRWAAYSYDSQPITTIVSLSFAELIPIYDQDYASGSLALDDVGF